MVQAIRPDSRILALLRGEAPGPAVAWRCAQAPSQELAGQLGEAGIHWLTTGETGRTEHPHSAFVRKPETVDGRPALRTTLYAPEGKLTELRFSETGEASERFVRRVADFKALRSYLKDICQLPPAHMPSLCAVGSPPLRELQARWAAPDIIRAAVEAGDEHQASCLRKLERLFRHRCEEAARAGAAALVLGDSLPVGDAGAWLAALDAQLDWLNRHVGLPLYVAAQGWDDALAQGLLSRGVGLYVSGAAITALQDMNGWEGPLMLELTPKELGEPEEPAALMRRCPRLLALLRSPEPPQGETLERLHALADAIQ